MPVEITLPHHFKPRPYQLPVLRKLDAGVKRAVAVWHRRAGKEKTFFNYMVKKSQERVGTYFYIFPTYTQGKKALWTGMDKDGFPFLSHVPEALIARKDGTDLMIEMINGSILQVVGSDNIDALMSTNPIGCVFAEYALQHPRAWEYIRPILKENGGWAIFDFTPRGKNHGYELYNLAKSLMESGDPNWFCQKLTVDDTGVLTQADIDAERREGMSDDMVQQEYFCSFEGVQQGSIFGRQMNEAEHSGRICAVPHQPEFPVDTWWDIGMDDPMAIWFTQTVGREIHLIDYYENNGLGMQHYAQVLQSKGYTYGTHNAPHDIEVREIGSGKSRRETALNFGIRFAVVPNIALADGIDAARNFLARCWFDREKCKIGLAALTSYHHLWNEDRKQYSSEPYHDWSSNGADAFRYLAVGHKVTVKKREAVVVQTVRYENEDSVAWMGT